MTDAEARPRKFWIQLNPSFPGPYNSDLREYSAFNREMPQREVPQLPVIELQPGSVLLTYDEVARLHEAVNNGFRVTANVIIDAAKKRTNE